MKPKKKTSRIGNLMAIKTTVSEEQGYGVTKSAIKRWFKIINHEIFLDELPYFRKIYPHRLRVRKTKRGSLACFFAQCEGRYSKHNRRYSILRIINKFSSEQAFVKILAHEMTHHFQWTIEHGPLSHGKSFNCWKPEFKKHGISLRKFAPWGTVPKYLMHGRGL